MSYELGSGNELGRRLRAAREVQNRSLRSLAAAIGVSPSLMSQVETGRTLPSLTTLYALVTELGISFDALLGREAPGSPPPAPAPVYRRREEFKHQAEAEGRAIDMDNGVRWERLSVFEGTDVEALRATYQPGASSSVEGKFMYHYGNEHLYLISGELTLHLDLDRHTIHAGDSVVFNAERPHLFVNASDEPAVGVWYIFGREAAARAALGSHHQLAAPPSDGKVHDALDVLHNFRTP